MRNARWRLVGAVFTAFAATIVVRPLLAEDEQDAAHRSKTDRSYYYSAMMAPDKALDHLARATEVSLLPYGDPNLLYTKREEVSSVHPVLVEFDRRVDLRGMPVIQEDECQLRPIQAEHLSKTSKSLRGVLSQFNQDYAQVGFDRQNIVRKLGTTTDADSGLLLQMLQCESRVNRLLLIEQMSRLSGPAAAKALAHRAVFELEADLRADAVQRLKLQVTPEARQFLLNALRYPITTFADNAAVALAALKDAKSVPALVALLDAPDPTRPTIDSAGDHVVPEIVRVNHARNCQLCHAPSFDRTDPARVRVPDVKQPLPPSFSIAYYEDTRPGPIVRADVTYLRQDFSLTLPVQNPGPWPNAQRYDFFVRPRPALDWELAQKDAGIEFPHRYLVLRTLRRITDRDFGTESDAWRKGLSKDGRFRI
jgi:hypothetical protein